MPDTDGWTPGPAPAPPPIDRSQWGTRADGSPKGDGFLGVLPRADGKVSSEISVGVKIDGKEVEIPTLVPTLTADEKQWLLSNDVSDPKKIPSAILDKAVAYAKPRLAAGKSPFAQPDEAPTAGWTAGPAPKPDFHVDVKASDSPSALDLAKEVAKGVWQNVNPLPLLKSLYEQDFGAHNPLGMGGILLNGLKDSEIREFHKAKTAYQEGRISEALGHTLAMTIPGLGEMAANAGESIGSGDPRRMAHGVGEAGAVLTPMLARRAVPTQLDVPAMLSNANPLEAEAVDFGLKHDIPIDAATASGNRFVRGAQAITEHTTPFGATIAERFRHQQAAALERTGNELAGQANSRAAMTPSGVTPGHAVSPEQAGAGVRGSLEKVSSDFAKQANDAYDTFRSIANDPNQVKPVTTIKTGRVGTQPVSVNISEPMAMPVDIRDAKATLKPVYDDIAARWPIARQQASPGFKALENIVHADDFLPATQVEANLGAVKALAREAGGPAKLAVSALEKSVDTAVQGASPQAFHALRVGRMATRSKYETLGVLDRLNAEPVQVFRQATYAKDAGIDLLRQVEKAGGPTALRDVGRAWLDDAIDQATKEGGFGHGARLWADWNKLGPETKNLLFRNKALVNDLDQFFLLSKKIGENPNPSGSALIGSINATGIMLLHPSTGVPYVIGASSLAKLLHSPTFVKAMTRGMKIRVTNTPAAIASANEILNIAGEAATPLSNVAGAPDQERQPAAGASR
jgi:hypothetical protein